ncbi:hypothetical protein BKA81DRAFT_52618 [Phyllosticta paracitricarpa]
MGWNGWGIFFFSLSLSLYPFFTRWRCVVDAPARPFLSSCFFLGMLFCLVWFVVIVVMSSSSSSNLGLAGQGRAEQKAMTEDEKAGRRRSRCGGHGGSGIIIIIIIRLTCDTVRYDAGGDGERRKESRERESGRVS